MASPPITTGLRSFSMSGMSSARRDGGGMRRCLAVGARNGGVACSGGTHPCWWRRTPLARCRARVPLVRRRRRRTGSAVVRIGWGPKAVRPGSLASRSAAAPRRCRPAPGRGQGWMSKPSFRQRPFFEKVSSIRPPATRLRKFPGSVILPRHILIFGRWCWRQRSPWRRSRRWCRAG